MLIGAESTWGAAQLAVDRLVYITDACRLTPRLHGAGPAGDTRATYEDLKDNLAHVGKEISTYLMAARADLGRTGPPPNEASDEARLDRLFSYKFVA
jgi:hypothetical protein